MGGVRLRSVGAFVAALIVMPVGGVLATGLGVVTAAPAAAASCTETWTAPVSGDWGDASNWSPASVPTSSDDVCITAPGSYTVTAAFAGEANSLTLGGTGADVTLSLDPGYGLTLAGAGTIGAGSTITATPGQSGYLDGAGSLVNDGAITVPTGAALTMGNEGGGGLAVTNAAKGSFTDYGSVNVDSPFTDHGSITVGAGGSWAVGEGPTFVHAGGTITNSGSFTTSGNNFLTFTQSGGHIKGNPLELESTTLVDSGGSGPIQLTYNDVVTGTIPAGQTVSVLEHIFLANETLTNDGTLEFTGTVGAAENGFLEGAIDNAGTFSVAAGAGCGPDGPLTNLAGGTVAVRGTLYLEGAYPVVNDGSFTVKEGGTFEDNGEGSFTNAATGTVTNDGDFKVDGSGISFTSDGALGGTQPITLVDTSLADQAGAGTFVLWGTVVVTGTVPEGQTLHLQGTPGYGPGILSLGGATLTNDGTITLGTLNGNAAEIVTGGAGGSLDNYGTIVLLAPPTGVSGFWDALYTPITNNTGGTVLVLGPVAYLGDPSGYGSGVTLNNDGTLTFAAGAQLILEGGEGTPSQGSSIVMGANATLNFTIDVKAGAPTAVAQLVQGAYGPDGSLVLGGTLSITTLGAPSGSFSLVTGITITNNFSLLQFGARAYEVTQTGTSLSVATTKPFSLTPKNFSGTAGQATTATLAKVNGGGATDIYHVSVNWGDSSTSAGTFKPATGGGVARGRHTYASPGTYTVTTTVRSSNGTTLSTKSTATIAPAP